MILGALELGTSTPWGIVEGINWVDGTRQYWLRDSDDNVWYLPGAQVEADYERELRDVEPSLDAQDRIERNADE